MIGTAPARVGWQGVRTTGSETLHPDIRGGRQRNNQRKPGLPLQNQVSFENAAPAGSVYGGDAEAEYKIVGITGSGACEVVKLVDKDGNTMEQSAHLVRFISEGSYSLASYSTSSAEYKNFRLLDTYNCHVLSSQGFIDWIDAEGFIIDNKTGNMYSVKAIFDKLNEKYSASSCSLPVGSEILYSECWGNGEKVLLQFAFTDSELQISTVLDKEAFANFFGPNHTSMNLVTDRFGNLLSYTLDSGTKIMRPDHTFTTVTEADSRYDTAHYYYRYQYAFNDIVYARAYNSDNTLAYVSYLDSSATFVDIAPANAYHLEYCKSLGYGETTAVIISTTLSSSHVYAYVAKYGASTPWSYTVTEVNIAPCSDFDTRFHSLIDNATFRGTHMYTFSGNDFYDLDVTASPTVSHIVSPNELKTMKFDANVNCIRFTAVLQATQQTVEGYIDTSKSGVQELVFEPYVLKYGDKTIISITPVNA